MNQRDCKKCVYYGGKRKGKVFCLNDKCVKYGRERNPRVNVFGLSQERKQIWTRSKINREQSMRG